MKIIIRHLGMPLFEKDLDPGEHTIGRSSENDIRLLHDFISRKHAKIFFKDGEWWYQDLRTDHSLVEKHPIKITKGTKIEIENQVELITEDYLDLKKTQIYDIRDAAKPGEAGATTKRTRALFLGVIVLAMIGGGIAYYLTRVAHRPMDANTLFKFVRPKVVEFVKIKNPKAIRDYQKYAGVSDEEFRDEIGFCTGFLVGPGIVLTANHCLHGMVLVDSDINFQLKTHDNKLHQVNRVLGFDIKKDFLFLEAPDLSAYGSLEINDHECKVGQKVYTIGNVAGEGIAIRDGIMASKTKDPNDPDTEFVRYSAAASPGNSGGPLVDEFGKVSALVFAATRAENYNVGTGSQTLIEGKNKFVDDLSTKKVKIETKNLLNYHPNNLVYWLYLPVSETWFENPDLIRPLENITTEVEVPADLASHYAALISNLNAATFNTFEQIQNKIRETGLGADDWMSQATKDAPIIVPYQTDFDALFYNLEGSDGLVMERLAVLSPMPSFSYKRFKEKLKKENKYAYKAIAQMLNINNEVDLDKEKYSFVYRTGSSTYKDRLDRFSMMPICQYIGANERKAAGWDDIRKAPAETVMKVLVGEGLMGSSYDSFYLRPNARRDFIIKHFDETFSESGFNDKLGRSWKVFSCKLFGNTTIDSYCLQLPQGVFSLSKFYHTESEPLLKVLRQNYAKYVLPQMFVAPVFWNVDALVDYHEKGLIHNLPLLEDVEFEKADSGDLIVTLKTLGIEFSVPAALAPASVRFTSGLSYNNGNKKWIGLGFEGVYSEGKNRKIFGVGVEVKGTHASSVLNRVREEEESKKELKNALGKDNTSKEDKIAGIWLEEIRSQSTGAEMTLFGYQAPIEKHSKSDRLMTINFYRREPFEIAYRLLKNK